MPVLPRTSLRERAPDATFRAVRPLLAPLGIARVTEITRLDRLDLPVFAGVRPRGRVLRVHAGKGLSREDARVGAAMEALELAVAEIDSLRPADARCTLAELRSRWPDGLSAEALAPNFGLLPAEGEVLDAVACELLGAPGTVLIPAELVRLPAPDSHAPSAFAWSSNGLASGNSVDEATLHGMLEVLERDAIAMNTPRDASQWLVPASLPQPLAGMAEHWRRAGIELIVRYVPNEFGLPCFQAWVHEPASVDVNLARGSGMHLDRSIALARAVCEAAQSRLSTLHGGRDDVSVFFGKYDGMPTADRARLESALLERLRDRSRSIDFSQVPSWPARSPSGALRSLRRRLASRGFVHVFRHRPDAGLEAMALRGLHVVKIVIARCEALTGSDVRLGPRLRNRVLAHG